ncbi:dTDP-4-dehydrorhamnose 3,5-epimerase [Persicobacter psychrovividus]|uniref:dTDP-4-dehydrorhamnose 3,5-epimerase n=1 Tax=Persicobacter psychrovividus TaxID=387638 RepID=A0ABN6LEX4_9BACT|nr:dTDP-4-dehydrorhamnose 3,5-epimerase [Persicobacter psychrovividus]
MILPETETYRLISPRVNQGDHRGRFVKYFSADSAEEVIPMVESFYSTSAKGVIRGMHFQSGEYAQAKLVTCVYGEILDVIVDLRKDQPTYGEVFSTVLSSENANCLYIPVGFAHGFKTLSEHATVLYHCTAAYSAQHEGGVHLDSLGFDWGGIDADLLSVRDKSFLPLETFKSPF